MTGNNIKEAQNALLVGQYDKIIRNWLDSDKERKLLPIVIRAYLETGEVNESEQLLNNIDENELLGEEYAMIFLLKAKIELIRSNFNNSLDFLEKGLLFCQDNDITSPLPKFFNLKAELFWHQGKLISGLEFAQFALAISQQQKNNEDIASSLNIQGMIYRALGRIEESLKVYKESLSIREKLKNPYHITNSLNNIAVIYWTKGKLAIALDYLNKTFYYKDLIKNKKIVANWINNIAAIKDTQGHFNDALKMYLKALELIKGNNDDFFSATFHSNIAQVYRNLKKYSLAKKFHNEAYRQRLKIGNPVYIAESVFYLTLLSINMNESVKPDEILQNFPKPLVQGEIISTFYNMILGLIAQGNGEYREAEEYWQKAIDGEVLDYYFKILAHEHLTLLSFKDWKDNPSEELNTKLYDRLHNWEKLCVENNLQSNLFTVNLVKAKLSKLLSNYDEAEKFISSCLNIASESDLPKHHEIARKELNKVKKLKEEKRELNYIMETEETMNFIVDFSNIVSQIN